MEVTRLLVVRHGETEWNVRDIWQGQLDSPLTVTGQRQVEALAERLRGLSISALYSSDLGRCLASAQPSAAVLGLPITQDIRLRERAFGVLEGLTREKSQSKYPGIWENLTRKDPDYAPQGGESLNQKQERFDSFFSDMVLRHKGQMVLVCTHGGGVDAILRSTLRLPLNAERPYTLWNCALNMVHHDGRRWMLDTLGDIAHLKGFESAFRPR
jgi:2,3-bisphosphoglycerate-dependent phosphoglycerate mutase